MITVAQRQDLADAQERTLAAIGHASDYQRPILLRIAEKLRGQRARAGRAEVIGGAAVLGREE